MLAFRLFASQLEYPPDADADGVLMHNQIRHMSLAERAKEMKKFVPEVMEPDFMI